ncbi:MAG: hypothetical protein ACOX3W_01370 [Christensenellaceae bacterium]|jgi:DNA-binding MurR/RpiR family transcriptional regulator
MIDKYCAAAVNGTKEVLRGLDDTVLQQIADRILDADNVFVVSDVGRPGMALMNLAQRLRQMGIRAYRLEESPPTPSVHEGDVVLIGSVDGEDQTSITFMKRGKDLRISYDLFTMTKGSTLEKDAAEVLFFAPEAKDGLIEEEYFELALYVVCDALALYCQRVLGVSKERMQAELPNIY